MADIVYATTVSDALLMISDRDFKAIIIPDPGLTNKSGQTEGVLAKLKTYIENGGLVIVGLHFPGYASTPEMNGFFEAFDLPWIAGL
ncbi:hypothetical protein N7493_006520 [Penicillium malachiteum]|uniref:Uncharacterized protein n=1 Tax=Penicillium malachiteum TaxID=1324776 RepID=A0AAD6HKQ6_9EURO|nr:hypothetical protein N7493_006520 [Penicillium malachiteum]